MITCCLELKFSASSSWTRARNLSLWLDTMLKRAVSGGCSPFATSVCCPSGNIVDEDIGDMRLSLGDDLLSRSLSSLVSFVISELLALFLGATALNRSLSNWTMRLFCSRFTLNCSLLSFTSCSCFDCSSFSLFLICVFSFCR